MGNGRAFSSVTGESGDYGGFEEKKLWVFHEHAKDEEMRLCDSVWLRGQFYIDALISACMEVVDAQSSN